MLRQKFFWPYVSKTGCKYIIQSTKAFKSNIVNPDTKNSKHAVFGPRMCIPTNFEKWLLVWMKKYKNKDEIPSQIRQELLYQTKNKARIKAANYMIGLSIIGCFISVYTGKQSAKRGDSIQKRILEWNKGIENNVTEGKTES